MHNFSYIIGDDNNGSHCFDSLREVSRDGEFTVDRDIWILASFIAYNGEQIVNKKKQSAVYLTEPVML